MLVCTGGGFQVSPWHLRSGHVSTESFGNLKTTSHPSQISATNPTGSIPLPSVSYIHTAAQNNALMQTKVPLLLFRQKRNTQTISTNVMWHAHAHIRLSVKTCRWIPKPHTPLKHSYTNLRRSKDTHVQKKLVGVHYSSCILPCVCVLGLVHTSLTLLGKWG